MSSPPPTSPPPMVWPPPPGGNVVPFPLPWGQTGCCPPGGMDALMKCYCDVQAATAFICSVMVQCIQQNPAVVQAIIAAIEASGSNLPLIGVTNGADAQPGQVGEWVAFSQNIAVPTGNSTPSVSMGILQAGDWDIWAVLDPNCDTAFVAFQINPLPTGFQGNLITYFANGTEDSVIVSTTNRALISVASPIVFEVQFSNTGGAAATAGLTFMARRRR